MNKPQHWYDIYADPVNARHLLSSHNKKMRTKRKGLPYEPITEQERMVATRHNQWYAARSKWIGGMVDDVSDYSKLDTEYQKKIRTGRKDEITEEEREAHNRIHREVRLKGTPEQVLARRLKANAATRLSRARKVQREANNE